MKNIVVLSTILALFAGAASAASLQKNERPDNAPTAVVMQDVKQVLAKTVYSSKELARANLEDYPATSGAKFCTAVLTGRPLFGFSIPPQKIFIR